MDDVANESSARVMELPVFEQYSDLAKYTKASHTLVHDMNNALQSVLGNLYMAHHWISHENTQKSKKEIAAAIEVASFMSDLLNRFDETHTPSTTARLPERYSLHALLNSCEPLVEALLPDEVQLITEFKGDDGEVSIHPVDFNNIFVNLTVSAASVMDGRGDIFISVEKLAVTERQCLCCEKPIEGSFAVISVANKDCDLNKERVRELFQPYSMSRDSKGLGLAIINELVHAELGHIDVTQVPNDGCHFDIYLPLHSETAPIR